MTTFLWLSITEAKSRPISERVGLGFGVNDKLSISGVSLLVELSFVRCSVHL